MRPVAQAFRDYTESLLPLIASMRARARRGSQMVLYHAEPVRELAGLTVGWPSGQSRSVTSWLRLETGGKHFDDFDGGGQI